MRRDLIFIHSAGRQGGDNGSTRLLQRLDAALSDRFCIIAPEMPDPERPDIDAWLSRIENTLLQASDGAVLVGHSLGGSTILQYLAGNPDIWRVNNRLSAVFVVAAPFWGLKDWEIDEFVLSANEVAVLSDCKTLCFCHGRDDEIVDFTHCQTYMRHFPHAHQITLDGTGHLMLGGDIAKLVDEIRIYA
ncbi:alpha/beta fold hydrolase [Thalassospira australica]|uniref:alpha/beta fold hydrolase n=1 Tax=Thalassospira australica TaxID=1528106 RepID=UPI00051A3017|nr:alpha/beta fold hydrolase [Thalassospira australica]